mgnify:CR=1 FL=1
MEFRKTEYFEFDDERAIEGYRKDRIILQTTRNSRLVQRRRQKDNFTCQACGFRLQLNGCFVIEVHHRHPLADSGEVSTTIEDLVSLCPNCHRIAHLKSPPYEINEIQTLQHSLMTGKDSLKT